MSETQEFFSFEEALDQLRLKEEELKRLVSEGAVSYTHLTLPTILRV